MRRVGGGGGFRGVAYGVELYEEVCVEEYGQVGRGLLLTTLVGM